MNHPFLRWRWSRPLDDWPTFSLIVLGILTTVVLVLYSPTLDASFQGDDFRYLHYLFFNLNSLLAGQSWLDWLAYGFGWGAWTYFRPVFQLSYLSDFLAWGLDPVGYHLSNLALHVLASFLVFVLFWQLTHKQLPALAAGLLFGVMPIHVEPVSWFGARADGLSTLWYLLAVVFFVLFRRRLRRVFLLYAIVAFVAALMTKESSVTLPAVLMLYDWLYSWSGWQKLRNLVVPQLFFWSVLAAYVVFRLVLWAQLGTFANSRIQNLKWDYLTQIVTLHVFDPFFSDMTGQLRSILLGTAVLVVLLYHSRREVLIGAAWVGLTLIPSLLTQDYFIFDRYIYLPSVGLSVVLASVLTQPVPRFKTLSRLLATGALTLILVTYARALYNRNGEWARAAQITQIVLNQVRNLHPSLPSDARLVFTNVPVLVGPRGMQAFGGKLELAIQLIYGDRQLHADNFSKFPIWLGQLDHMYFFEYDRRRLVERADLVQALEQRKQCADVSSPSIEWTFSGDTQGWEFWNELSAIEFRDGVLVARSLGEDPQMGSPPINIPALAIGDIDITMRVSGTQPTFTGLLYWLASGQQEFSPGLKESFEVKADGEMHTYHVNLADSGMLLLGDQIERLRLDPIDGKGEIALESIRVYSHCSITKGALCTCVRN